MTIENLVLDKYNGARIPSDSIIANEILFEKNLTQIIQSLIDKNLLWITVKIENSNLLPILTKNNFTFHHCNEHDLTLVKKLKINPIIPTAKNHTLGVGAVVISNNKLLVIKDMFNKGFKLPGGHIDNNEKLSTALVREVLEETGVIVEFENIISLGHFTIAQFGESNLYVLCTAKALSLNIDIQDTSEILEAKWMELEDFFTCEDVLDYNKKIVNTALLNKGLYLEKNNYLNHTPNELFFNR